MSAIRLTGLSWSTPDGHALFSQLDLTLTRERCGLVGRNGTGKSTLLRLIAGELTPRAGSVTVTGCTGALPQDLRLPPSSTLATLLGADDALAVLARISAGTATDDDFGAADWTLEARLSEALARTGLDLPPDTPLNLLSGGQATRAALAALIFADPDILLLDEPSNHLDRAGRRAVRDLLAGWRKTAVVASHDRELLEVMDTIVELNPTGVRRYGGPYSAFSERRAADRAALARDVADAEKRAAAIARDTQQALERQARRDSAGRRHAVRGDAPKILLGARRARAEASAGGIVSAGRERTQAAREAVDDARRRIAVTDPLSLGLIPTGLAAGRQVVRLDAVTAGYDPARPLWRGLDLIVTGPQRLAVTGGNGVGKSTLLKVITGALAPFSGRVEIISGWALLDQNVSLLDPALSLRDNFRRLHPDASENACRAALARFMFRADAALSVVGTLSGGERLRGGLACVLGAAPPPLLILDEPSNHLDLDSLEAVEAGLAAFDGALIVVSHDETFLDAIGVTRRIELGGCG